MLAISVGPNTPNGFLGKIDSVAHEAGKTILHTSPATLEAALPEGSFELAQATRVDPAGATSAAAAALPGDARGARAHGASSNSSGTFNKDLSKAISCDGGATFSAAGTVGLSATPRLSISWSLFHGVSATFTETVSASASLSGSVSASANCAFARTALLREPAHLGTFVGDVLGVPVVVAFEGQIYLDGKAEVQRGVNAGISGRASASGGLAYSHGKASIIPATTSLQFAVQGPTVQAGASVGAHVTPELQALLYGVGGPVFDAKTGLDFSADTTKNPWWTLSSPLVVTAALEAPVVGLSTPTVTLYSHTFSIAHAAGAFGPPTPPPLPPTSTIPSTGPTLIYDGDTAIPMEGSINYQEGDLSFSGWSEATGQGAEVDEVLPSDLSRYRCVVLMSNETLSQDQSAELAGYGREGGTIVAVGEHEGGPYALADETLNELASSVGVGLALGDDYYDYGPNVTFNILSSPLTEDVFSLGDNWASSVSVSGAAQPLAEVAEGGANLIGEQTLGAGTFVMAGDSNMFSDDNEDFYHSNDNGQLVRNLCP